MMPNRSNRRRPNQWIFTCLKNEEAIGNRGANNPIDARSRALVPYLWSAELI
ncbi:uncharacterized protein METZ01_LOCUS410944 [marine metagenome]|uniref:Uncharacterized protein n=1 Tax=marine metagenome TaxID=408172 RepID=A0A382WHI3_9ZZZZ